jgi:hypothetical protein
MFQMCSSITILAGFFAIIGTSIIIMIIVTPNHWQTFAQPASADDDDEETPKMICPLLDELIEMSRENRFFIRLYF